MRRCLLACFGLAIASFVCPACGGVVHEGEAAGSGSGTTGGATAGAGATGGATAGVGATGGGAAGSGGAPDCTASIDSGLSDVCETTALNTLLGVTPELGTSMAAVVADVTLACRTLALDLGADMGDVTAIDPARAAQAWCALAAARIGSEVTAQGTLTVSVQAAHCEVEAAGQAVCELACVSGKAECAAPLGDVKARCPAYALGGSCTGVCMTDCDGSETTGMPCGGSCSGACTGPCNSVDLDQGACPGKCLGACFGSCAVLVPSALCAGKCMGACGAVVQGLVCIDELAPPFASCAACTDGTDTCAAVGLAKAQCVRPGLGLTASGAITTEAVASLRATVPTVLEAGARCERMLVAVQRLVVVAGSISGKTGLATAAAVCLTAAAEELGTAAALGQACLNASVTVSSALGG